MWALLEDSRLRTILLRCKGRRSGALTAVSRHAFEMIKSTPSVDSPCFQGSSPIAVPSRKSILHVPVYYYLNITNNIEEKGKMRGRKQNSSGFGWDILKVKKDIFWENSPGKRGAQISEHPEWTALLFDDLGGPSAAI